MKKEVRITVEGIQGDVKDTVTAQADGVYYYKNGKHIIRYEEAVGDGDDRLMNTLKLSPGQIMLKKEGRDASSQMIFDLNEITRTEYPTPYGGLSLQIETSEIVVTEGEDEVRSVVRYSLSDSGGLISENEVRITIVSMKQE